MRSILRKIKLSEIVFVSLCMVLLLLMGFMGGRGQAQNSIEALGGDWVITAEEEYLLQVKFLKEQEQETKENWVEYYEHDEARGESVIKDLLVYEDQHTTFNRTLPYGIDYKVGWNGLDKIANYIYHKTKDLPHPNGWLIGLELAKTWSLENATFSLAERGQDDEFGICQLRYAYHSPFITSEHFSDAYAQVDYCVDVYLDRYNRKRPKNKPLSNVWTQWSIRDQASYRFEEL